MTIYIKCLNLIRNPKKVGPTWQLFYMVKNTIFSKTKFTGYWGKVQDISNNKSKSILSYIDKVK